MGFGPRGHIPVAEDGETWHVAAPAPAALPARQERGDVIDAPIVTDPLRGIARAVRFVDNGFRQDHFTG